MTASPTSPAQYFESHRTLFGPVPSEDEDHVCGICLGPVNAGFRLCRGCEFLQHKLPAELRRAFVPMTSALNPSPWYTQLSTYKRGRPEYGRTLVALTLAYLRANHQAITAYLGGRGDLIAVVPSKRGVSFENQPLRVALSRLPVLEQKIRWTLEYNQDRALSRHQYEPASFRQGPDSVEGKRVILIEDTWVTGATAMSAAGALLEHGAATVLVLACARAVDATFWPETHPYRERMDEAYDPSVWPRRL